MFEPLLTGHNITAVLVGAVTFLVFVKFVFRVRVRKPPGYPPGPPGWPVLGNLASLAQNAHLQLTAWRGTYGDVFSVKMGLQDAVVVSGKDAIREALVRKAEHFSSRPDLFLMHCNNQRNGIAMRPYGLQWKILRRFSTSTLRSCGMGTGVMENKITLECQHFCTALKDKTDQPFDLTNLLHNAVANVICSVAIGKRFEYGDPTFLGLMEIVERALVLFITAHVINIYPVLRFFPVVRGLYTEWMDLTVRTQDCMMDIIEKQKSRNASGEPNNIIDAFTKSVELNPDSLPDHSLMYLLIDLFGAGTETTANTLRWGLLYLMTHPDVQMKVQAELDEVVGRDRPPAVSDKPNLPYTEATIMEMQRIRTVVPLSVPHCTSSDTTLLGYDIPAGTDVLINLWSLHMDPGCWDNPDKFDPGRFLDDNGQLQTHDSFMPFSTGRRVCLGEQLAKMELFLFLTIMLQQFIFKLPEGARPNFDGILGATLRPESFELIAVRRE
ncbi:cytochrome P450 2D3-like [Branchiostoma lanceolatum]|uniref:cytochrome P450 2D3-like n=1 Tax=Branchiostoma lanceolatum TaxID=7740 RepID=UPI0034561738